MSNCIKLFLLNLIYTTFSYHVVNIPKTWDDAESFCQSQCNSHLASIHSKNDLNLIVGSTALWELTESWIGLRLSLDNSTVNWSDNTPFDYNNTLDQSSLSVAASCIEIQTYDEYNGTWNNSNCTTTNTFICNECMYDDFKSLPTYYVSPNRFELKNAITYCNDHCNSELASIHSENDHNIAMHLATNGAKLHEYDTAINSPLNVYIGLFTQDQSQTLLWMDNTTFNYGNITTPQGIYPWKTNEPNISISSCVLMKYKSFPKYQWVDGQRICDETSHRFMCNACDGELNKYVVIHSTKANYTDAETYCNTYLGTSLASIHNKYDYNLAKTLCDIGNIERYDITSGCFIGLNKQNKNAYQWMDGTEFDFGRDTKDTSIWVDSNVDMDCVEMSNDNDYKFTSKNCNESSYFLCNIPSMLCTESDWNTLIGNHSFNACEVYSDSIFGDNIIVSNKQWINQRSSLMIEHTFKFISIRNGSDDVDINAGIIIFDATTTDCDYYYVSSDPIYNRILVYRNRNGIDYLLDYVYMSVFDIVFEMDTYYRIKLTIGYNHQLYVNAFIIVISINDNIPFYWFDPDNDNTLESAYIGIRNQNSNIHTKYLYISGASYDMNAESPFLCTMNPTSDPTTNPTSEPTYEPTLEPTVIPTLDPTVHPTLLPSTKSPFNDPTTFPIINPTIFPTTHSSILPTINPLSETTTVVEDTEQSSVTPSEPMISTTISNANVQRATDNTSIMAILYIGAGFAGCFLCCLCLYFLSAYMKQFNCFKDHNQRRTKLPLQSESGYHMNKSQFKTPPQMGNTLPCTGDKRIEEADELEGANIEDSVLKLWLTDVVKLPEYYSVFIENGYENIEFVRDIALKKELKEIGIVKLGHQTRILSQIRRLSVMSAMENKVKKRHLDESYRTSDEKTIELSPIHEDIRLDDGTYGDAVPVPSTLRAITITQFDDVESLISADTSDCDVVSGIVKTKKRNGSDISRFRTMGGSARSLFRSLSKSVFQSTSEEK